MAYLWRISFNRAASKMSPYGHTTGQPCADGARVGGGARACLNECVVGCALNVLEVGSGRAVIEFVEAHNVCVGIALHQMYQHVRATAQCTTLDEGNDIENKEFVGIHETRPASE